MTDESQEHAIRSPSSSHGWRRCPGRINAERGLPDRVGREAAEGTVFHDHAELALRLALEPHNFKTGLLQTVSGHTVCFNDEMIQHMGPGLQYIYARMDEYEAEFGESPVLMVEQRVFIEPWTLEKGGFGTSDVCIIFPRWNLIIVFDWKYGKIAVSPMYIDDEGRERGNDQLTLYALGCWGSFAHKHFKDIDPADIKVELTIWQPRVPGAGGTFKTDMAAILEEGERIKEDAAKTYDPNAIRIPGPKQCQYCKASAGCKELAQYNLEQFSIRFDDIDDSLEYGIEPPEPEFDEWTPERKAFVLLHKKVFERWFKKLHEEALLSAAKGAPFPFTKIVMGNKGVRFWTDKKEVKTAVKALLIDVLGKDKAVIETFPTPAVVEKAIGKKKFKELFGEYVDQPPSKPILVPTTDTRKAIPTIGQKLDELMADEDNEDGEDNE